MSELVVVLVRPGFAENVGAAARAMANFGAGELRLVAPRNLDLDRARKTATVHAGRLVDTAAIFDDLETALADCHAAYGTTARTGGWRQGVVAPDRAGAEVAERRREGQRVALVFGPEDRGLENAETMRCTRLIHIPTAELSSLNLGQAVLLVLYECFRTGLARPRAPAETATGEPGITMAEQEALFAAMQQALSAAGVLKEPNPEYWMLPLRRFFAKVRLKKGEFNLLMGVCRQVSWLGRKGQEESGGREAS